jgi:hypothetical protein
MDMSYKFRRDQATELRFQPVEAELDIRVSPWLVAEILADLAEERARRVILASGGLRSC